MIEKEYYETRDRDLKSGTGTKEIKALFEEIDDARTEKDTETIKLLEFGCGSGMTMLRLQSEFNIKNIKGIDNSEYAIKLCKNRGLNVELNDVEDLKEYKDKSFDIVYGQYILEHTNAEKVIKNALRIAKNKVIFIISFNHFGKEKLAKLLRKVPGERHKFVKDIVRYVHKGTNWRNWIIILYPKNVKKDIGGVSYGRDNR